MKRDRPALPDFARWRFFLLCRIDERNCGTQMRGIRSLQDCSRHKVDVFNLSQWPEPLRIGQSWDWQDCDGIIVHGSLSADAVQVRELAGNMPGGWKGFEGLKLLEAPVASEDGGGLAELAEELGFILLGRGIQASDLDHTVSRLLAEKEQEGRMRLSAPARHHVLQLCSHEPHRDPRLEWVAAHSPQGILIHTLGCSHHGKPSMAEQISLADGRRLVITEDLERFRQRLVCWEALAGELPGPAAQIWTRLAVIGGLSMPRAESAERAFITDARDLDFASLCRHFALTAAAIVEAAMRLGRASAIIATDLDTLLPACILKELWKAPLLCDSHEFWSESFPRFSAWERDFWREIESRLFPECDAVFTVSDPLAELMSGIFKTPIQSVPNCEPYAGPPGEVLEASGQETDDRTIFLYMGNYAEDRGLEKLVKLWPLTPEAAVLHLRGHKTGLYHKLVALAQESGLLDKRIFFHDPVPEREMVAASRQAHVGLIPYEAIGPNNRFCCPNKLSQYCAAGLAILANKLDFVDLCIQRGGNGLAADIGSPEDFAAAVAALTQNRERLQEMKQNSLRFHEQSFNWQEAGKPLYSALERLLAAAVPAREDHPVCFRAISGRMPMGLWSQATAHDTDAESGSQHEKREAYIKSLHYWMSRRDEKIAALRKEKEALKAKLKKKTQKQPEKKKPRLSSLAKRLIGRG